MRHICPNFIQFPTSNRFRYDLTKRDASCFRNSPTRGQQLHIFLPVQQRLQLGASWENSSSQHQALSLAFSLSAQEHLALKAKRRYSGLTKAMGR
jgi:hypothetical protein